MRYRRRCVCDYAWVILWTGEDMEKRERTGESYRVGEGIICLVVEMDKGMRDGDKRRLIKGLSAHYANKYLSQGEFDGFRRWEFSRAKGMVSTETLMRATVCE